MRGCGSVRLNVLNQAPEIIQLSTDDDEKTEQGNALQEIPQEAALTRHRQPLSESQQAVK